MPLVTATEQIVYGPGRDVNEAWEHLGHPCFACQKATVIYRNPFHARLAEHINQ